MPDGKSDAASAEGQMPRADAGKSDEGKSGAASAERPTAQSDAGKSDAAASPDLQLYARQYKIVDGRLYIDAYEDMVSSLLPPEPFQEMHVMVLKGIQHAR